MSEQLDILNVDMKIRKNFQEQFEQLEFHKIKLAEIEESLHISKLKSRIRSTLEHAQQKLLKYIQNLENQADYN